MPVATITAEAAPAPDYEAELERVLPDALEGVGAALVADARASIDSQTAPDGSQWPPRKDGTRDGLLRSNDGPPSIYDDLGHRVAAVEATVSVGVYGASSEYAGVQHARRAFLPITRSGAVELPEAVDERTRASLRDAVLAGLQAAKSRTR